MAAASAAVSSAAPLAPDIALPGTTAVAGQILSVDGQPLANVFLNDGPLAHTRTGADGRFLLRHVPPGKSVLVMDGRRAGNDGATDYGTYDVQIVAAPHRTTPLSFTSWLTPIDHAREITIPSPTTKEVVVTNPAMPGLELRIPAGTIITDRDGNRVDKLSLTPISADRPPFPLPENIRFQPYFTAQPGGATLWTVTGEHAQARVVYPNHGFGPPGARTTFWHYQPAGLGWIPYGAGTVSDDGKQLVPDPGTFVYDFMGGGGADANGQQPNVNPTNSGAGLANVSRDGEPVDLATGLFVSTATDLAVADVIPISVTRSYISSDQNYRNFGLGVSLSYNIFPKYQVSPDRQLYAGLTIETPTSSIPFVNATPFYGNFPNATFNVTSFPGPWLGARASWNGNGITATLRDGNTYAFGYRTILQYIQDRFANRVTFSYQQVAPSPAGTAPNVVENSVVQIASPNGKTIALTYGLVATAANSADGTGHYAITQAQDSLGRTVTYGYDTCGRLISIKDAHANATGSTNATTLGWAPANPANCGTFRNFLVSITDANNHAVVTNTYATATTPCPGGGGYTPGRVCSQVLADGTSTYRFSYAVDSNNNITATTATDPKGNVHVVNFMLPSPTSPAPPNTSGYPISETWASGSGIAEAYSYVRDPNTFELTQITAPKLPNETAGRVTKLAYDGNGNITSVIRNYTLSPPPGSTTQNATTTFTYSPTFNQLASITDPNRNLIRLVRNNALELATSVVDGDDQTTSLTYTASGQLQSATQVATASQTIQITYAYDRGDLSQVTQILQTAPVQDRIWTTYPDAVGRPIQRSDPLGDTASIVYDPIFGPTTVTDANGNATGFAYDPVGNLMTAQDARMNQTTYTYDTRNRVATFTDPLTHQASYTYDPDSNLNCTIDRRGNQTTFAYDALNRLMAATDYVGNVSGCPPSPSLPTDLTFGYGYDLGNRLLTITQTPGSGSAITLTRTFDDLDRLSTEAPSSTTSVGYSYDLGSRLTGRTATGVASQALAYDGANNLLSIVESANPVCFTYDQANRRQTLVYPGGLTANYSYDSASGLLSLTYATGGSYSAGPPPQCTPGSAAGPGNLTYTYDQTGRQITRAGSLFQVQQPAPTTATAIYDADNRLTNWNGTDNLYDLNGNLTCQGSSSATSCTGGGIQQYSWDTRNRLTAAIGGAAAESYTYDGLSRRETVTGSGATGTYLYDGQNIVVRTVTGSNTDTLTVLNGLGLDERYTLFDANSGNATWNVVTDVQGSTVQLNGTSPSPISYSYPPFGGLGNPSAVSPNPFRYTGREASANTGLLFFRGRYYNPTWGRFVSEDPLGIAAGPNLYTYTGNDPLNRIDPAGLATLQLGFAGNGTFLGIPFQLGFGIAIDSHGNVGTYSYAGSGVAVGLQAGYGGSIQLSNANTIGDLSGYFNNSSFNAGAGIGGSLDYFTGVSANGPVTGGGVTLGSNLGAGGSLSITDTWISPVFSPAFFNPAVGATAGSRQCQMNPDQDLQ